MDQHQIRKAWLRATAVVRLVAEPVGKPSERDDVGLELFLLPLFTNFLEGKFSEDRSLCHLVTVAITLGRR
jgi:hypothetical protein